MSLVAEDGTGLSTAESYISVANASAYHAARGNTDWAALASDTVREQCLRKATDYMVQVFRRRWMGARYTTVQALDWPRSGAYADGGQTVVDVDEVPVEVTRACAEYALKASAADLLADLSQGKKRVKVGPIETEYDENSDRSVRYPAIEAMLSPYLTGAAGQYGVART